MAKEGKKAVRAAFRSAVFNRAGYRCEGPGPEGKGRCAFTSAPERATEELDAHHITDRNELPAGGYVAANGIALCRPCHELAERWHATGTAAPGYAPEELYRRIGSSLASARKASEQLAKREGDER